jgi:hypothetical protein
MRGFCGSVVADRPQVYESDFPVPVTVILIYKKITPSLKQAERFVVYSICLLLVSVASYEINR